MKRERWDRLVANLRTVHVDDVRVDEKRYSEVYRGRVQSGVSCSITIRRADGWLIEIQDTWWRKNPDIWTGWRVTLSDRDAIVRLHSAGLKHRSEVVDAVLAALDGQGVHA